MSAPRVLVSGVVLAQPMGGVRRHNAELLPRVAALLAGAGGALAVLEGDEGIPFALPDSIERIASDVPAGPPLARALREGRALRAALDAARARGRPFDLVHTAHLPVPHGIEPYTLTVHDLRGLELDSTSLWRRLATKHLLGRAVRGAAAVFTVSDTVADAIAARFRIARPRVIGNGCDHFQPLPRSAAKGAPLVHVGHLEPRKNLALLVRALALDPSLPALDLWGAPKAGETTRIAQLALDLGVAERVHLRGPCDDADLPRIYATCAAVVLPSKLEGFSIPALEAQRALAPLAISNAGALPEIAGPDVPSFPPDDPRACAAAIHAALACSPAALERDRARASERTWDRCAREWVSGLHASARV